MPSSGVPGSQRPGFARPWLSEALRLPVSAARWRRVVGSTEAYLLIVLVALSAGLSVARPEFLTLENVFDILRNYAFLGIVTLGELVVLVSGGIDVSFSAVATVAQYLTGMVVAAYRIEQVAVPILMMLVIGAALGSVNGLLVLYTGVHPVIITIATLNVFYALLIFFTGGSWIVDLPMGFQSFAQVKLVVLTHPAGYPFGLSVLTGLWMLVAGITWFVLGYTPMGRKVFAFGGNPEAARRAGYHVPRIILFVYSYMGMLAGLGGFVQAQLAQIIQPNAIVGRELDVLAAAILGGASIFGGRGSVPGAILGVLLIAVIRNGLILMRVSSYWHDVVVGATLVLAAGVTAYQQRLAAARVVRVEVE